MDPARFYNDLASHYDLIFHDWEASMALQGDRLDQLIRAEIRVGEFARGVDVLDISAGIGTQALPLARRGYRVTARDISSAALHRLDREAALRNLSIPCDLMDMRCRPTASSASFDVILSFDNALPHLLSDDELLTALHASFDQLRPGGLFLASVRDYSAVPRTTSSTHQYGERTRHGHRYRLRQDWTWTDADHYDATMIIEQQIRDEWVETTRTTMSYYAVSLNRLLTLMEEAGFSHVRADSSQFYQPILIGHRVG